MFDNENHYIDPQTGFARHKDTGHLIGLEEAPPVASRETEWPKWVVPHESYVVRPKKDDAARTGTAVSPSNMEIDNGLVGIAPDQFSTPGWQHSHVNRADGVVTVLVANEDEEKLATSEYKEPEPAESAPVADEAMRRAVRADIKAARQAQNDALARQAELDDAKLEDEEVGRRLAEHQERRDRDAEAADKIAAAQRQRLDEGLGAPNAEDRRKVLGTENVSDETRHEQERSDPKGWDPQHAVVRLADGTVDKAATNEERAKRGIVPLQ